MLSTSTLLIVEAEIGDDDNRAPLHQHKPEYFIIYEHLINITRWRSYNYFNIYGLVHLEWRNKQTTDQVCANFTETSRKSTE